MNIIVNLAEITQHLTYDSYQSQSWICYIQHAPRQNKELKFELEPNWKRLSDPKEGSKQQWVQNCFWLLRNECFKPQTLSNFEMFQTAPSSKWQKVAKKCVL